MDDIFTFGKTGKISIGAGLRNPSKAERAAILSVSSESSDSSGDECRPAARRGRRRKRAAAEETLASRLMHNKAVALEPGGEEEDVDVLSPDGSSARSSDDIKKPVRSSVADSSPSPPPSPPSYMTPAAPTDKKSRQVLEKCNQALYQLKWSSQAYSTPVSDGYNDSLLHDSSVLTPGSESFTLRVRCRGKMHKYTVQMADPLSQVCSKLARELKAQSDQVLLSHRTVTVKPSESPASLGLTTADIIDAIVMDESVAKASAADISSVSLDDGEESNSITIKVQSSNKSITYKLSKNDPLQKAMTAFASTLDVPLYKVKFSFDGDDIQPSQTANDLDIENDDVIDARII